MKLLTKTLAAKIPPLYSSEDDDYKTAVAKFFTPWTYWTWYVVEGEQQNDGDWLFFGRVDGFESEFGYFTLSQLESVRGPAGLRVERDRYFDPVQLPAIAENSIS